VSRDIEPRDEVESGPPKDARQPRGRPYLKPLLIALLPVIALIVLVTHGSPEIATEAPRPTVEPGSTQPGVFRPVEPPPAPVVAEGTGEAALPEGTGGDRAGQGGEDEPRLDNAPPAPDVDPGEVAPSPQADLAPGTGAALEAAAEAEAGTGAGLEDAVEAEAGTGDAAEETQPEP
jgi:hypothetical protein